MVTKEINLDIWKRNDIAITVNQGEKDTRIIQISFKDNGEPLNLSGKEVVFYCRKPDGKVVYNSCEIIDSLNGIANLNLTSQILALKGVLLCEFHILENEGNILKVSGLKIIVLSCHDISNSIESCSEFTYLTQMINDVKQLGEKYTSIVEDYINYDYLGICDIAHGGTGASNSTTALENLGIGITTSDWNSSFRLCSRSGTNPTYTTDYLTAKYMKIGKFVYITLHGKFNISNWGTDYACIQGLPFKSNGSFNDCALAVRELHGIFTQTPARAFIPGGKSQIFFTNINGDYSNQWKNGTGYIGVSGVYIAE